MHPDTLIQYFYSEEKSISLKSIDGGIIKVDSFSDSFSKALSSFISWFLEKKEGKFQNVNPLNDISFVKPKDLNEKLNSLFESKKKGKNHAHFIPDDRADYHQTIRELIRDGFQSRKGNESNLSFASNLKDPLRDEYAYERFSRSQDLYSNGLELEARIEAQIKSYDVKGVDVQLYQVLLQSLRIFEQIIKGKYYITENHLEFIYVNEKSIPIQKSSSGQQEVVGIAVLLTTWLAETLNTFIVIEEPEAHLFPKEQDRITQLMALTLNALPHNQMIITTHSPYILTAFNNLILAGKIAQEKPEASRLEEVVDSRCWIEPDRVNAFYIEEGRAKRIISNEGLIEAIEIDEASDSIGDTFDELLDILRNNGSKMIYEDT